MRNPIFAAQFYTHAYAPREAGYQEDHLYRKGRGDQ